MNNPILPLIPETNFSRRFLVPLRAWKAFCTVCGLQKPRTIGVAKVRVLSISVFPSDLHEVSLLRDTASKRASARVSTYASGGCRFAKGTALVPLDERARARAPLTERAYCAVQTGDTHNAPLTKRVTVFITRIYRLR